MRDPDLRAEAFSRRPERSRVRLRPGGGIDYVSNDQVGFIAASADAGLPAQNTCTQPEPGYVEFLAQFGNRVDKLQGGSDGTLGIVFTATASQLESTPQPFSFRIRYSPGPEASGSLDGRLML